MVLVTPQETPEVRMNFWGFLIMADVRQSYGGCSSILWRMFVNLMAAARQPYGGGGTTLWRRRDDLMEKKEVPLRARVPNLILLEETIYYTLNEVNGMIAPDVAEEHEPCYANKAASALAYWAISKHEDGTSIKNVEVIREGKIFDLSGRRVTKMDRGVFIIDGKKIVK